MQAWALLQDTFRELTDKKLFWVNLMLSAMVAAGMACISFDEAGMHVLFGWKSFDDPVWSTRSEKFPELIGEIISSLFIGYYIGWIGTMLGLACTAGIFPNLMSAGQIDCLLARPLSRWKIFWCKYAGGLLFMAVQGAFFVIVTFLVVGWRWHVWLPGYLWSIPLLVLLFSYLYCVSVLLALWSRSALASLVLTLAFWFAIWVPQKSYETIHVLKQFQGAQALKHALSVAHWVLPNTSGIPRLAVRMMTGGDPEVLTDGARGSRGPEDPFIKDALSAERTMRQTPWYFAIGSSVLFEAAVLLLAGWLFSRRDF